MADAGRVIAGTARGVRLAAGGAGTRALGDRVKQTLFAMLEPELRVRRVLDLFAGTGSGGIEALSRGAPGAVFVDSDAAAIRTIEDNLERCRLAGPTARVMRADTVTWLAREATTESERAGSFGIVLADPPYDRPELLASTLELLGGSEAGAFLDADAIVVAKSFWRSAPPGPVGLLASERTRRFGETALTFYRRMPKPASEA